MYSVKRYLPHAVIGFLFVVNIFVWQKVFYSDQNHLLKVYFLNVGQGDATLIEAPNGNQVLIDGGPSSGPILRELGEVLSLVDKKIDVVVATHPDADHIGGLQAVLERFEVGNFLESGNKEKDTQVVKNLNEVLDEKEGAGLERLVAKRGDRIMLDTKEGVYVDVLFPDRDVSNAESNSASIVLKLVYGNTCFIFTGDAPIATERYLVSLDGKGLDCEVLKAGHHGSKTSSSKEFVGFVSPEVAVISAGLNNRYGHPHKEVLDIFNLFKVKVLRTDEVGRIEISSNGEEVLGI